MPHEIFEAIAGGDLERVRSLAAAAAERNDDGVSALLLARYHGRGDMVDVLRPHAGELHVWEAAALGETDRVRQLVEADPALANAFAPDGFQPLGLAVFFGHPETAALLVELGADVSTPSRNDLAVTPLHSACAARDLATVHLLLARGADPNVPQPSGFRPLDAAREHGDEELARLLRGFGARDSAG
jgi:uncharacterized protein